MDRNKITRHRFRHLLVESSDNLSVTFPASPCPYPAGRAGAADADISYAGDSTPKGGIPVTGARLQRVLNKAAYEDNVRRGAAGSAMTSALQGVEEGEKRRILLRVSGAVLEGGGRGGVVDAGGPVLLSIATLFTARRDQLVRSVDTSRIFGATRGSFGCA